MLLISLLILWFTTNIAEIHETNLNISESCSVHYTDATWCRFDVYQGLANQIATDLHQEYIVLNASQNSRIFMIRWGYISGTTPSSPYSVANNVFIEAFMDDSDRNDASYVNEFTVHNWNLNNDETTPSNIFPPTNSYVSCNTIYLLSDEYINQISYKLDETNLNALIALQFVTSNSQTFVCPPPHDDDDDVVWDFTYSGADLYWMLVGFEFKVFGEEQYIHDRQTGLAQETYIKQGIFAGFESIKFGYSCNPPCFHYDSDHMRVYNENYFTKSADDTNEYLIYNQEYAMAFDSAQSICSSIGSSLATIHSFNSGAISSFVDGIWMGTVSESFWIDGTPILLPSLTVLDANDNQCGYYLSASQVAYDDCALLKTFYCNNPEAQSANNRVIVWLRSCDEWMLSNHKTGALQVIFKGEFQFSPFTIVNDGDATLPSDDLNSGLEKDKWRLYDISSQIFDDTSVNIHDYGMLIQFEMQMDYKGAMAWNSFVTESSDFCMAGMVLQFADKIYSKTSSIKGGVVLSTKCSNQWVSHVSQPYFIQCIDNLFRFSAVSDNGAQYKVAIRTCPQSSSGISASDANNLKVSLTGKSFVEGTWASTPPLTLSYPYVQPQLSKILTSVASQNVFLSGDLLPGSEITRNLIRGSIEHHSLISPQDFAFSPPDNGPILGYHVSYASSVRLIKNDYDALLRPIMYKLSYKDARDYVTEEDDLSAWKEIIAHVAITEPIELVVIVPYYNETANETSYVEADYTRTIQKDLFLAADDLFRSVHDYKERTVYITNDDDEMYVVFNQPVQVTTSDSFMISMVLPQLGNPWGFSTAVEEYGYATSGPVGSISFIYQNQYDDYADKPYTLEQDTTGKTWEAAGSKCFSEDDYANLASIANAEERVWAQLEVPNNDDIAETIEPILIRMDNQYEPQWMWVGGKNKKGVFKPKVGVNEYFVTMNAIRLDESDSRPQDATIIITGGPANAFAEPDEYLPIAKVWSAGPIVGVLEVANFVRPVPPVGYRCLSDIVWQDNAISSDGYPSIYSNLFGYRCINESYLVIDEDYGREDAFSRHDVILEHTVHEMQFGDTTYQNIKMLEAYDSGSDDPPRRATFYKFRSSLTQLSMKSERKDSPAWIGLRKSEATNEWTWIDQTALSSDVITLEDVVYSASGDCGALSARLLSTSVQTTYNAYACDENKEFFMCETADNGDWHLNEEKSFLVTVEPDLFDEVILVALENTGDNAICVDEISVNEETATFISSYWIANTDNKDEECLTHSCQPTSFGIIKYPVCAISVLETRYNFEDDAKWEETANTTAAVAECSNYNRLSVAACEISQSIAVTDQIGFEISHGFSYTEAQSSGTSTVTETSRSNGGSLSISDWVGIAGDGGGFLGKGMPEYGDWTRDWNYGTSTIEERFDESSYEESTEHATTNAWSQSTQHEVSCIASIDVAPSHRQTYSLFMNRYRGIIPSSKDLRLTLCSAFIDPEDADAPEHYMYIYNVPSQEFISSITKCEVQFDRPSVLLNQFTCDQEQELSWLSDWNVDYMPTCNETDATRYDGCQCRIIHSLRSDVCTCVDPEGNVLNTNAAVVAERDDWRDVCRHDLGCADSQWTLPTDEPTTQPTTHPTDYPTNAPSNAPTKAPTHCIHDIRSLNLVELADTWDGFIVSGNCLHSNYFKYYVSEAHPEAFSPDEFSLGITFDSLVSDSGVEWSFSDLKQFESTVVDDIIPNNNIMLDENTFPALTYDLRIESGDPVTVAIEIQSHIFHMGYNAFAVDTNAQEYCCDPFNAMFNGITFEINISNFPFAPNDESLSLSFEFAADTSWNAYLQSNIHLRNEGYYPNTANGKGIITGSDLSDHYNDLFYLYLPTFAYVDGENGNSKRDVSVEIQHSDDSDGISAITITFPRFENFVRFGELQTQQTEGDIPLFNHPLNNKINYAAARPLHIDPNNSPSMFGHGVTAGAVAMMSILVAITLAVCVCFKNKFGYVNYRIASHIDDVIDDDNDKV